MKTSRKAPENTATSRNRRGVITLWMIAVLPVFVVMLVVVIEVGNLWTARIQLKNALESAAMAGAYQWGNRGNPDTTPARGIANRFAEANVINGRSVDLQLIDANLNDNRPNTNNDTGVLIINNNNVTRDGVLVFGAITSAAPSGYVFDTSVTSRCVGNPAIAVRAQATVSVPSITEELFGVTLMSFNVTARADVFFDCATQRIRVYHLDDGNYIFP